MRYCKTDLKELFPHSFQPEPVPTSHQIAKRPSTECIARWEDDGGQSLPTNWQRRAATGRSSQYGHDMSELAQTEALATMKTAAAAYASAWTMFSGYGR